MFYVVSGHSSHGSPDTSATAACFVSPLRTPGARAPQDRLSQHLPDTVLIVLLDVDIQIGKHAFLYTY